MRGPRNLENGRQNDDGRKKVTEGRRTIRRSRRLLEAEDDGERHEKTR